MDIMIGSVSTCVQCDNFIQFDGKVWFHVNGTLRHAAIPAQTANLQKADSQLNEQLANEGQTLESPSEKVNERLLGALTEANEICRSALSIAERHGNQTNWTAFGARVSEVLNRQHEILYPKARSGEEDRCTD